MNIITYERVAEVLYIDHETGRLYWKKTSSIRARGEAGYVNKSGYRIVMIDGKNFRTHRIVWLLTFGSISLKDIDHINGDRLDNRFSNLRQVTRSQNNQNQGSPHKGSESPYLGVTWDKQAHRWRAQINVDKRHIYLGIYKTADLARSAYISAKRELHSHGDRGWA